MSEARRSLYPLDPMMGTSSNPINLGHQVTPRAPSSLFFTVVRSKCSKGWADNERNGTKEILRGGISIKGPFGLLVVQVVLS